MKAPMTKAEMVAAGDMQALTGAIRIDFVTNRDNIPAALKAIKGWLVWKATPGSAGKFNKVPYYPGTRKPRKGQQGAPDDLAQLGTFEEVIAAFDADARYAGVGLAMLSGFDLVALDVDRCVEDGVLRADVALLTEETYCEISPSGTGIRAFWVGSATGGKNSTNGFELYPDKQFVTVTGQQVCNSYSVFGESLTVGEAFIQEQARLLALPGNAFPTEEVKAVSAGKTPYVRFDRNDYSIPHDCVSRTLTVAADLATVRILDGQVVIATHPRSFDRQQQIECPEHVQALVEYKRAAGAHRGADQLITLIPTSRDLLTQATERGEPLGRTARALNELLAAYGVTELTAAIADALARGVPHPNAVRLALERHRQASSAPPPLAIPLPDHVRHRDVPVRPHPLNGYDHLMETDDDEC